MAVFYAARTSSRAAGAAAVSKKETFIVSVWGSPEALRTIEDENDNGNDVDEKDQQGGCDETLWREIG